MEVMEDAIDATKVTANNCINLMWILSLISDGPAGLRKLTDQKYFVALFVNACKYAHEPIHLF